jgi:hypothetical protein
MPNYAKARRQWPPGYNNAGCNRSQTVALMLPTGGDYFPGFFRHFAGGR